MEVVVHTLLIYVLYASIIVILLEAKFRRQPLLVFIRAFLLIVQGTWFWQVGHSIAVIFAAVFYQSTFIEFGGKKDWIVKNNKAK